MKHLIVTGGSSGIGLAIATRFAAEGWRVLNLSRHPCPDPRVENLPCDLALPGEADALAQSLTTRATGCEQLCLVHNASVMQFNRVDNLLSADLRRDLELNLIAPAALNRTCIPLMPRGSSILYIGSTLAEKAVRGVAGYIIAKHGLVGMMRATCQDLAGRGIHTCMICPGFTDTPLLRSIIRDDPEVLASFTALSAFDRLVEPREIADAVHFAAQAPVLNGALIHANLGQRER